MLVNVIAQSQPDRLDYINIKYKYMPYHTGDETE